MKSLLITTTAIACIILAAACDHPYYVEYEIQNDSETAITIQVDHSTGAMDTSAIANNTRLIFFNDSGLGSSATERHLKRLKNLPFEISIANSEGTTYKKDALDLANWEKIYPEGEYERVGRVRLTVRPEDFD